MFQPIPFYGSDDPVMFALERQAMDRAGKVIEFLNAYLPNGQILDVGAGNGFTAERLTTKLRQVFALEPSLGMLDRSKALPWLRGIAQTLPFQDQSFAGSYATWAFFFNGIADLEIGVVELERVVKHGGSIAIIDNAGNDEFSSFASHNISADPTWWEIRGFNTTIIETAFEFDSLEEAQTLMSFYFGETIKPLITSTRIGYNVAAFCKRVR